VRYRTVVAVTRGARHRYGFVGGFCHCAFSVAAGYIYSFVRSSQPRSRYSVLPVLIVERREHGAVMVAGTAAVLLYLSQNIHPTFQASDRLILVSIFLPAGCAWFVLFLLAAFADARLRVLVWVRTCGCVRCCRCCIPILLIHSIVPFYSRGGRTVRCATGLCACRYPLRTNAPHHARRVLARYRAQRRPSAHYPDLPLPRIAFEFRPTLPVGRTALYGCWLNIDRWAQVRGGTLVSLRRRRRRSSRTLTLRADGRTTSTDPTWRLA